MHHHHRDRIFNESRRESVNAGRVVFRFHLGVEHTKNHTSERCRNGCCGGIHAGRIQKYVDDQPHQKTEDDHIIAVSADRQFYQEIYVQDRYCKAEERNPVEQQNLKQDKHHKQDDFFKYGYRLHLHR